MNQPKARIIDPRQHGHKPLNLERPVLDADAAQRADDAVKGLRGSFERLLEQEVAKVQAARLDAEESGWRGPAMDRLCHAAHDLKGIGATYEYPLATQIAASLCRLIETDAGKAAVAESPALARAHVDALRAILRAGAKTEKHPAGGTLLRELEAQVDKLGVAPR